MKKCPFCAEQIQDDAVKCRFCGEFLIDAPQKSSGKWYQKTSAVVVSILCFGPLALPLVWYNPHYRPTTKTIATIAILVFTIGLCVAFVGLYALLLQQLETLGV